MVVLLYLAFGVGDGVGTGGGGHMFCRFMAVPGSQGGWENDAAAELRR